MRFAIIGAGAISWLRKSAIGQLANAELAGVYDIAQDRAAELAGDAQVFSSLENLMGSDAVDAVIICTPPDTHESIAQAALDAGKHVLVEKPMANSLEACARMTRAARGAGKVLTVGFNHRYFPAIKELKTALNDGRIGRLSHVRGYTGHVGLAEFKAPWMYARDVMGGGALMDNGIHMIDLVHHLMGPVAGVYGQATTSVWEIDGVEDNAYAVLTGKDGVIGTIGASWSEWKGYHFMVEAYGSHGMARAYYAPMRFTLITLDKPGGKSTKQTNNYIPLIFREKFKGWQSTAIQTFVEEISDFIALAEGRRPEGPIASEDAGFRSIEIANAVYDSGASGKMVNLRPDI